MNHNVLSVYALVHYIKQTLDQDRNIQSVLIKGEISNFTNHRSGHWYFTLKDKKAKINCVMFSSYAAKCKILLKEGMKVIVQASVSMYEAGGSIQLYVTRIQIDGLGDLFLQLEEVKRKLQQEGLFLTQHKKKLPLYPMRIGVISARTGAAIQDILTTISRRWPLATVQVYPSLVQGIAATDDIIRNLQVADKDGHDVILLARGGGAIEDLWCFNEERLARCIFQMNTVIVTGVGHETDTTLVDYVSDARAPTPTAAAELITPDIEEVKQTVFNLKRMLERQIRHRLTNEKNHFLPLKQHRYMQEPLSYIQESQMRLALHIKELSVVERHMNIWKQEVVKYQHTMAFMAAKLQKEMDRQIQMSRQGLFTSIEHYRLQTKEVMGKKIALLNAFSPLKILERGYAITYQNNQLIKSINDITIEDEITIRMQDGYLYANVKKKEELK